MQRDTEAEVESNRECKGECTILECTHFPNLSQDKNLLSFSMKYFLFHSRNFPKAMMLFCEPIQEFLTA